MKTRIRFNNLVVTAEELSKIEKSVKALSNLAPSDAFIEINFFAHDDGYRGLVKVFSSLRQFEEGAVADRLVDLMDEMSTLIMVHIELWKKHRFDKDDIQVS